jgi:hypothetical protein
MTSRPSTPDDETLTTCCPAREYGRTELLCPLHERGVVRQQRHGNPSRNSILVNRRQLRIRSRCRLSPRVHLFKLVKGRIGRDCSGLFRSLINLVHEGPLPAAQGNQVGDTVMAGSENLRFREEEESHKGETESRNDLDAVWAIRNRDCRVVCWLGWRVRPNVFSSVRPKGKKEKSYKPKRRHSPMEQRQHHAPNQSPRILHRAFQRAVFHPKQDYLPWHRFP